MTALEIITSALGKLNVVALGTTVPAEIAASGLETLNELLESWSIDRLLVFTIAASTYNLVDGKASYTIGLAPGQQTADLASPRPARIENANILIGGLPYPLHLATDDEWAARGLRSLSAIPSLLYNDGAFPLSTLSLYPAPAIGQAYQLELFSWQALQQFADLAAEYSFPPGYARALRSNFALELAADYQVEPSSALVRTAIESKALIENLNIVTPTQSCDAALLTTHRGRQQYGWLGNYR